ncbi:MAG: F0F1 ATP synthase subunit A [Anaerolinea sp.]|nr:F0F1 ATP synthase subunit A [Anaerolinea sp.]
MNATQRGGIGCVIVILFLVACVAITFGVLPALNTAVAIPVIMVPGEPYDPSLPVDSFRWTNTLTAMVLGSLAVLAFAFFAWRSSNGWKREVPSRFQSWVEMLGGFIYDFSKGMAGARARWVFPLVATIFVFLLAINWMKLLPGVESVGVMHCAEEGFSGYPAVRAGGAFQLYVDQPLYAGQGATEADYEACNEFFHHGDVHAPEQTELVAAADLLFDEEAALRTELTEAGADAATIDAEVQALRLEVTESVYHHPSFALTADQLREGAYPYIFIVTPFLRGGSTDLNLTIGLALISVISIQVFGVLAQGPNYFQKFINLRALGNAGKNPIGAIDVVVGLIEIISELGKIISLAFRLFGNMFAGGILLIVMSFLVAAIVPMVFYGLELIITTIQALVFAVLTLVFAAQAMEGHHGDEEHHDEHSDQPVERTHI